MVSTSRTSPSPSPSPHPSTSTSDESFVRYKPPSAKLGFNSDKRYHVFLSFRGEDVRKTFVDHLFEALSVAGLNVYKDDENLEKGEMVWPSLEAAIESSAIRIPVLSKGYADSDWCLREAGAMARTRGLIIPLFYDVKPTHVRYPEKGSSPYWQSFQRHRGNSYYEKEEIDRWNGALHHICDRSGWSMDITDGFEARMVKTVVNDLIKTLDRVQLQVAQHPVGLDGVKNALIQKLTLNLRDEVIKVGIWGIGGIGKTTVAKAVYNQVYLEFEAACFLSNVRTTAAEPTGLTKLQEIILKNLSEYGEKMGSVDKGISLFRGRLGGKRVLLVLDDVDAVVQLNALLGVWLAPGSRVIVTSRDKHILNLARVECIHEMSGLEINEGLQLFSWYAFLRASPSPNYEDLSKRIVEACKGHPLSLEVIGSFLYDKQDDTGCWNEALQDITHNSEIYEILYISYSALSDEEKEIFVDIACFFIGEDKTLPIIFWESLYKKVHTAISNLSMKLLIKIDNKGLFEMHDHLRDMGQTIAEKEKKGTRKWKPTHLSTASNNISRLKLIGGNPQSLEMLYTNGLHYLHLENLTIECMTRDTLFMLPSRLIWLRLDDCNFEIRKNVTVKKPHHSRIVDNIRQCKILQLNGHFHLDSLSISPPITPISLCNLIPPIGDLSQLWHLDLHWCENLSSLPNSIGNLSQLRQLDLHWCSSLNNLPNSIGNLSQLQHLDLHWCVSLSSLPDSIGNLSQLQHLNLEGCESLNNLPNGIGKLPQLQDLNLEGCDKLSSLPDGIGNLSQLQDLNLEGCGSLTSLPDNIGNLPQLQKLDLFGCGNLGSIPASIGNLSQWQKLDLACCQSLSSLPDSIGNLSQVQDLNLEGCRSLSSLPDSIGNLSQVQQLNLTNCDSLSNLPHSIGKLSQLQKLYLNGCRSLSSLPDSIGNLLQLQHLDLGWCENLSSLPDSIGNLSQLQKLNLRGCWRLSCLPDGIGNLSDAIVGLGRITIDHL